MAEANTLSTREIQLAEYGILCTVVDFLEKNGLHYILAGGTMLGAVRHGGFIPWDDDVDILMPRADYEALKALIKDDRMIENVRFCLPGDADHLYPFIKAVDHKYPCEDARIIDSVKLYLWVDIFPLDHFPDDEKEHAAALRKLLFWKKMLYAGILKKKYWKDLYKGNIIKQCKSMAGRALYTLMGGYPRICRLIDRKAMEMDRRCSDSDHVGDGSWPEGMKDYFPVSATFPTIDCTFETGRFKIPQNYDLYLTLFYGDYMTLPPEEKRVTHSVTVYK